MDTVALATYDSEEGRGQYLGMCKLFTQIDNAYPKGTVVDIIPKGCVARQLPSPCGGISGMGCKYQVYRRCNTCEQEGWRTWQVCRGCARKEAQTGRADRKVQRVQKWVCPSCTTKCSRCETMLCGECTSTHRCDRYDAEALNTAWANTISQAVGFASARRWLVLVKYMLIEHAGVHYNLAYARSIRIPTTVTPGRFIEVMDKAVPRAMVLGWLSAINILALRRLCLNASRAILQQHNMSDGPRAGALAIQATTMVTVKLLPQPHTWQQHLCMMCGRSFTPCDDRACSSCMSIRFCWRCLERGDKIMTAGYSKGCQGYWARSKRYCRMCTGHAISVKIFRWKLNTDILRLMSDETYQKSTRRPDYPELASHEGSETNLDSDGEFADTTAEEKSVKDLSSACNEFTNELGVFSARTAITLMLAHVCTKL